MTLAAADLLQQSSTGLGNLSLSVLVGSVVMPWASGAMPRPHRALHAEWPRSAWASGVDEATRRVAIFAWLGLVLAHLGLLWWQSATMGDVPLSDAAPQVWPVLAGTHFGAAWIAGALGLAVILVAQVPGWQVRAPALGRMSQWLLWSGLFVVFLGRAATGHAGSTAGPLALAMDFVHLVGGCLWVGLVIVGAWIVFRAPDPGSTADQISMHAYVETLSTLATIALVSIAVTGAFATWRTLMPVTFADIADSRYGQVLVAKLALVGIGAALGAHNRYREMPALVRALRTQRAEPPGSGDAAKRFQRVLAIEAVVLAAVLAAAALLATSPPPGSGV
jgi:putative copper resistance protein D